MHVLGSIALVTFTSPILFAASPPSPTKEIGVNLALRDPAVKPGDDFEEHANGAWRKTTEIPADRSSVGVSFEVFQKAEKRNADLIKEAGAGKPAAGYAVLAFSEDRRTWVRMSTRVRSDIRTDRTGHYATRIPPGRYYVVALAGRVAE